jgi:hypothetical protein
MDSSLGRTGSSSDSVAFLSIPSCGYLDCPEDPRAGRTVSSAGLIAPNSIVDLTVLAYVALVQVLAAGVDYWRQGFGASPVLRNSSPPMV